jgi:hypothetical protein
VVSWSGLAGPAVIAVVSLYLTGLVVLWKSRIVPAVYFLLLAVAPVVLMWLSRPFDLYTRFFFFYLPYYVLLASLGVFTIWSWARREVPKAARYGIYTICISLLLWIGAVWISGIQSLNPDPGYREAIKMITHDADSTVGLCAIGAGAELFQFYADKQITVPASVTDIEDLLSGFSEIRCVYSPRRWEAPFHTKIAEFLFENAQSQKVGEVFVFRYTP